MDRDVEFTQPSMMERLVRAISFGTSDAKIGQLSADPAVVVRGQEVKIEWSSMNAAECSFNDNDVVYSSKGQRLLRPMSTMDLELECTGDNSADTRSIQIPVLLPPVIERFTADQLVVETGDGTQLSWVTKHAEECALDNGIGNVALEGSVLVRPTKATNYTLYCSTQNVRNSAVVRIDVREPTPRCSSGQELVDGVCRERCADDERRVDGYCEDRCDGDERWNGNRCVSPCGNNEYWDGEECVAEGLERGEVARECDCWGPIRIGQGVRESDCASGRGRVVGCHGWCSMGGVPWAVVCR